jgi:hypothetical protein
VTALFATEWSLKRVEIVEDSSRKSRCSGWSSAEDGTMRRRAPGLIMDRSKKAAYAMIKVRSRMLCWRWRGKVVGGEEVRVPCYAGTSSSGLVAGSGRARFAFGKSARRGQPKQPLRSTEVGSVETTQTGTQQSSRKKLTQPCFVELCNTVCPSNRPPRDL